MPLNSRIADHLGLAAQLRSCTQPRNHRQQNWQLLSKFCRDRHQSASIRKATSRGRRFKSCQPDQSTQSHRASQAPVPSFEDWSVSGLAAGTRPLVGPHHAENALPASVRAVHIWVQIARRNGRVLVPSHPLQDVERDSAVRHPGQCGVSKAMAHQPGQAEIDHPLAPIGRIPQGRRSDYAALGRR